MTSDNAHKPPGTRNCRTGSPARLCFNNFLSIIHFIEAYVNWSGAQLAPTMNVMGTKQQRQRDAHGSGRRRREVFLLHTCWPVQCLCQAPSRSLHIDSHLEVYHKVGQIGRPKPQQLGLSGGKKLQRILFGVMVEPIPKFQGTDSHAPNRIHFSQGYII